MSNASDSSGSSTERQSVPRLRIFFDADVLISGAAPQSRQSASYILIEISEFTLIEGIYSPYVARQAERNIAAKLPAALPDFHRLLNAALTAVSDADAEALPQFQGCAALTDVPVLAAAALNDCRYLITRNVRHFPYPPEGLEVVEPGRLVSRIRSDLSRL